MAQIRCPSCKEKFEEYGKWGKRKYCSRSCSNRGRGSLSEATKRKISDSVRKNPSGFILDQSKRGPGRAKSRMAGEQRRKGKKGRWRKPVVVKPCENCKEYFEKKKGTQKFCTRKCFVNAVNSGLCKGITGGYREGSGRAKTGYYNGIYCGSTYELVWVIYNLDHGMEVRRFDGVIQGEGITYVPDFMQNGKIVEIKGWFTKSVDSKTNLALSLGYEIDVLYKKDMKHMFDWVKSQYKYKDLPELYDELPPSNVYVCGFCEKEFYRGGKVKYENVYCSRICLGKSRVGKPSNNIQGTNGK